MGKRTREKEGKITKGENIKKTNLHKYKKHTKMDERTKGEKIRHTNGQMIKRTKGQNHKH